MYPTDNNTSTDIGGLPILKKKKPSVTDDGLPIFKKKDVGITSSDVAGTADSQKEDPNEMFSDPVSFWAKRGLHPMQLQSNDPINEALVVAKQEENIARSSGHFDSYLKAKQAVQKQKAILNSIGNNGKVGKQLMDNIIGDNSDNYSIPQLQQKAQGNITASKSVKAIEDKRETDDAINTTTDFYRAANKKYSKKENEFQSDIPKSTQGDNVRKFLNDPNVIERTKDDPEFAKKYNEAKFNWMNDFPVEASKDVNQKIGQYMEDKGMANMVYNNPGKQKVDKAVDEMRKLPSNDPNHLDDRQSQLYEEKTRPNLGTLHSMLWGSPIPTADIVNTYSKSLEKSGNDIMGGIRDIADKISFGTISTFGESDADRQKRILEERASEPTVEPKGEGKKMALGVANLAGFATPMILGEMAGIPTMATMTAQFEGGNRKTSMELYPEDKTKQDIYTILATTLDVVAGQKLPIKAAAKTIKGLVSDVVDGKITQQAAKEQFNNFINDAVKNTVSGANAMALMQVGHNGLEAALGGRDFKVGEQASELLEQYPKDLLNMAFLGGVAAAKHLTGEVSETETPKTVDDIHTVAKDAGVDINTKEFKDKSKDLTGEEHLDNMTPEQLSKVNDFIQSQKGKTDGKETKANAQTERVLSTKKEGVKEETPSLVQQAVNAADDINEIYRQPFIDNPEKSLQDIADQLHDPKSEETTRKTFGDKVSDIALELFPKTEPKVEEEKQIETAANKQKEIDQAMKPKLDDLPFLKTEEFDKAQDSGQMEDLNGKQKSIKQQFKALRKIADCIWAI